MGEQPEGADIVEQGGRQFRLPGGWRPTRAAGVLAATTLAVGLAAGYAAGNHQARGAAPLPAPAPARIAPPSPAATPSSAAGLAAPATAFSFADSPALTQGTAACATQTGRDLQLGVQVSNLSTAPLILRSARAVLPLGGLKQLSRQWATCGSLPGGAVGIGAVSDNVLEPGASTWLTVTFRVQVRCPAPYPVQFSVGYFTRGHAVTASLPGFPDLGQVPYSGCPAGTRNSAAQRVVVIDPVTGQTVGS